MNVHRRPAEPGLCPANATLARVSLGALLLLLPACQGESAPDPLTENVGNRATVAAAEPDRPARLGVAPAVGAAAQNGSFALSLSDRGVPNLLVATSAQPAFPGASFEGAARFHLARHLAALGLSSDGAAAGGAELLSARPLGKSAVLARFRQRLQGIEVYGADARVLMKADLSLAALAGQMYPSARPPRTAFRLPAAEALAAALGDLYGIAVTPDPIIEDTPDPDFTRFRLAGDIAQSPIILPEPARAKRVWFPDGDSLIDAYFVELYAARTGGEADEEIRAYRYLVGASDGRILERRDLTESDSFDYRVFAEASGDKRPLDGPTSDFTPHPSGRPDGKQGSPVAPNLITMEGFNRNPMGVPDPWLDPGATGTDGNNANAYCDRNNPDGLGNGDVRPSLTGPKSFDRVYDTGASPTANQDQGMASATNLFYTINWLHDYFYDSGFDEKAGNAQKSNYGRGGSERDAMRAEAQDNVNGGARNNANMSTPTDGMTPRMQVYVWGGNETRTLTVTPPGNNLSSTAASYGLGTYDVTADIVLVQDNANPASDGCTALVNAAALAGKIALIDRGTCSFQTKSGNAEAAGAIAVIIADNQNANNPPTLGGGQGPVVTIGTMGIRLNDGNAIKAALQMGPVKARMVRRRDNEADGALDNTVLAHEWGHYIHHRLSDCSQYQCRAISEGWGDFLALHTLLRDGDDLDGAYPMAPYAARSMGDSYYGLRRMPYSIDFAKNALTFKHITAGAALPNVPRKGGASNNEVHSAGEVWASMLWEAYVAMHKEARMKGVSFDEVRRRMADYIVAGLQITPADSTYLEARDAILAAVSARNKDDLAIIAQAFARRGAGSCAVGPARNDQNLRGVTESTEAKGRIDVHEITADDSLRTCDSDGQLDADERGRLTISLGNGGPVPLKGAKVTVLSTTAGVTFPAGATTNVPEIAALGSATVSFDIALDKSVTKMTGIELEVDVDAAETCEKRVVRKVIWRGNYDELPMSTATDDVESRKLAWTADGVPADKIWSRQETGPLAHAIRGLDWGALSDTSLQSPDFDVSPNEPFTLKFDHRFTWEEGEENGARHNFDGAVIELSEDGGGKWEDVSVYGVTPGYGGIITTISGNPLANRTAFVNKNAAWPNYDKVALDFGDKLAGKKVRIRFRIGTDQAAGEFGWEIDNIASGGVLNKPFATLADDTAQCKTTLVVNAGPDQTVKGGAAVVLDASMSKGDGDKPLTFNWVQKAGPMVSLADPAGAKTVFTAPAVMAATTLTFEVTAAEPAGGSGTDTVDIIVEPGSAEPMLATNGCNCRVAPGSAAPPASALLAFALAPLALLRRRRRHRRNRA